MCHQLITGRRRYRPWLLVRERGCVSGSVEGSQKETIARAEGSAHPSFDMIDYLSSPIPLEGRGI